MAPPSNHPKVMRAMPGTTGELAERTGLPRKTVESIIARLHAANGTRAKDACHVGRWKRSMGKGGAIRRVYYRGHGTDAPCDLVAFTSAENSQRWRDKVAGTDVAFRLAARQSAKWYAAKASRRGDPLVNALFGRTNFPPPEEREQP